MPREEPPHAVTRSRKEIQELLQRARQARQSAVGFRSKYPGLTYEEGVQATLSWLLDREEKDPLPFE